MITIKKITFNFFKAFGKFVSGKGLAKVPFAVPVYQFFYKKLKPSGVVEVEVGRHTMLVNSQDTGLAPPLIMHGEFSPAETDTLRKILKKMTLASAR